jgi:phosphoglycerate dehydrogenase-like enzyme
MKNKVRKVALLMYRYPHGIDKILVRVYEKNYRQFAERFPDIELVHCGSEEEFLKNGWDCDVLWTLGGGANRFDLDLVCSKAPNLKWICSLVAGTEGFFQTKVKDMDILMTSTKGIHGKPMSDHCIALIYGWLRNIPQLIRYQDQAVWKKPALDSLSESEGKTVGVIGLGTIGTEIARKLKALDFRVLAYKRTPAQCEYVDKIYLEGELDKVLTQSDFIVIVAPLTPQTTGMFGKPQFEQMKKDAVIINMGRGPLVKTDDLVEALKNKVIGGACLDVTDPEPLPSDHPLWKLDNVIISPHCSPNSPIYFDRATASFCDNLESYLAGEPMLNVVTKDKGY